jgi:hypothetical protein
MALELCDCHFVNEGHLALNPVTEGFGWKGVQVQNYQLVSVDCFPNCGKALYEIVEDPLVLNEQAVGAHIKMVETFK